MHRWALSYEFLHDINPGREGRKGVLNFAKEQVVLLHHASVVVQNRDEGFLEVDQVEGHILYPFSRRESVGTSFFVDVRFVPFVHARFK